MKSLWVVGTIVLILAAAGTVYAQAGYTLHNLRLMADPCQIQPFVSYAINNRGEITGHGYMFEGQERARPFYADPVRGVFLCLGDMAGDCWSTTSGGNGYGISEHGWIIGRNQYPGSSYHAFLFIDENQNDAVEAGEMRSLGFEAPYTTATAQAVNNVGQVVGIESYFSGGTTYRRGFIWNDLNGNRQVDPGEKVYTGDYLPMDINDAGQVVCNYDDRIFRWTDTNQNGLVDPEELVEIPNAIPAPLTGLRQSGSRINNRGQVSGVMRNILDKTIGFLWTDVNDNNIAEIEEIQLFGDDWVNTFVRDMNEHGQIVGGTYAFGHPMGRRAYFWDPATGQMVDLNDGIAPYSLPGRGVFCMSQAEGINDCGQIVATAWFDDDGNSKKGASETDYAILLNPILAGDLNGDFAVDMADFAIVAGAWDSSDCSSPDWCDGADLNQDGAVDLADLAIFSGVWLGPDCTSD